MKQLEISESGRPVLLLNEIELSIWLNVDIPSEKIVQSTMRSKIIQSFKKNL